MNDITKKQSKYFMFYNLFAFSIIFSLFALIIYLQISNSLFVPIKEEFSKTENWVLHDDNFMERQLNFSPLEHNKPPKEKDALLLNFGGVPIRINTIIRDSTGEIINKNALGRLYWDNLLDEIPFSADNLDSYINFNLNDNGSFQGYSFEKEWGEEKYYIQLIADTSGEQAVIDNIRNYLILGIVLSVLLSIIASYYLSQKSMTPLIKSWNRQSEFVENASHELRTPLTIIQNKLETLLTTPYTTILENSESIGVVLSETKRLSKLTSDLMTLARADSNASTLTKENFLIDELITFLSEPYSEIASLQNKTMKLDLQCANAVFADKLRIHELMVILLDNALKYTREKDVIEIKTFCKEKKAYIQVRDSGIGFSKSQKEKLFDRFYREEKARSRETGGSGLGLSIAKWIVDEHGGSITIEATDLQETVIEVCL